MVYFGWLAITHKIIATVAKIVLWSVHHLIRLTKSWPFRLLAGSALTCLLSLHPRRTVYVCVFSCGKFMANAAEEQIQTFGQSASIERS